VNGLHPGRVCDINAHQTRAVPPNPTSTDMSSDAHSATRPDLCFNS
jgi:hypothetical protein